MQLHSLLGKIKSASTQHPPYADTVSALCCMLHTCNVLMRILAFITLLKQAGEGKEEREEREYQRWWEKGADKQLDEHCLTSDPNEAAITTLGSTTAPNLLAERMESSLQLQDLPLERSGRSVSPGVKDAAELHRAVPTSQSPGSLSGTGTQADQGIHKVLEDQTLSHRQDYMAMADTLGAMTTLTTPLPNSDTSGIPPATFPTEIPDYSDDFCSEGRPQEERRDMGLPAEDRSLRSDTPFIMV